MREAGELALSFHKGKFEVFKKADGSPVTSADLAVHDLFVSSISQRYPEDCIVSEEGYVDESRRQAARRAWIIDPIDGTSLFIAGRDCFGILVGLWEEGRIVASAASFPAKQIEMYSARGEGCFLNGKRVFVSDRAENPLISCWGEEYATLNTVSEAMEIPSLAMVQVAAGQLDGCMSRVAGTWGEHDVAFACCAIEEAGGTITDETGNALTLNLPERKRPTTMIWSNGRVHRSLMQWA